MEKACIRGQPEILVGDRLRAFLFTRLFPCFGITEKIPLDLTDSWP